MKIFHSMALNNRTPEQIKQDRAKHHAWIKENYPDGEILTTFIDEAPPAVKEIPLWYFGKGIADHLSQASLLVVPYNWNDVRGVRCEKYIAEQYGVPVVVMPNFDSE